MNAEIPQNYEKGSCFGTINEDFLRTVDFSGAAVL